MVAKHSSPGPHPRKLGPDLGDRIHLSPDPPESPVGARDFESWGASRTNESLPLVRVAGVPRGREQPQSSGKTRRDFGRGSHRSGRWEEGLAYGGTGPGSPLRPVLREEGGGGGATGPR